MIKDLLGRTFSVGDIIAYSTVSLGSVEVYIREVIEVGEHYIKAKIFSDKRVNPNYFYETEPRRIILGENCLILPKEMIDHMVNHIFNEE
jgi:hypothetical protein